MGPNIRPLELADRARWEEMFAGYAAFYRTEVPEGGMAAVWSWIFDPENDFWCDVVEDASGALSGFVQYQLMHRSLGGTMTWRSCCAELPAESAMTKRTFSDLSVVSGHQATWSA